MNTGATDRDSLVEDLFEASTDADPVAAPVADTPAQAPEATAATPAGATPESEPPDASPAAAAEPAQVPGASDPQQPFTPPDRGDPLTLRVDGVEVPVPDARRIDGYIVIPERSFARVIQTRLADRGSIARREQGYQQKIAELERGTDVRIRKADAVLARVQELLDDPAKLEAFAMDHQRNAPLLIARAEAEMLRQQVEQQAARDAEAAEARAIEEATPHLQEALRGSVDEYVVEMRADLTPEQRHELAAAVWRSAADAIFTRANGQYSADEGAFRAAAERELTRIEAQIARQKQTTAAARTNAAAVAPTQPGRVAAPAKAVAAAAPKRDPASGQFQKQPKPFDKDEWLSNQDYDI